MDTCLLHMDALDFGGLDGIGSSIIFSKYMDCEFPSDFLVSSGASLSLSARNRLRDLPSDRLCVLPLDYHSDLPCDLTRDCLRKRHRPRDLLLIHLVKLFLS